MGIFNVIAYLFLSMLYTIYLSVGYVMHGKRLLLRISILILLLIPVLTLFVRPVMFLVFIFGFMGCDAVSLKGRWKEIWNMNLFPKYLKYTDTEAYTVRKKWKIINGNADEK